MSAPIFGKPYVTALPGLLSAANPGAYVAGPVLQAGDITVYKNNVLVPGGLDSLPVNDPPGSPRLRIQLSADEMSCDELLVYFHSPAGLWSDVALAIQPRSSLNSGYVDLVLGTRTEDTAWLRVRKTGAVAAGPSSYGVRVKLEVLDAYGVDKQIFVYHKRPLNLSAGTYVGDFNHVCSPTDFGNYPVDDVSVDVDHSALPRFYRSAFVDLLFDSIRDADEFERVVWEDIYAIKQNMDRIRRLTEPQTVTVGPAPGVANIAIDQPAPPTPPAPTYGDADATLAEPLITRDFGETGISWTLPAKQVFLKKGENAKTLLFQGFNFSEIPSDAKLIGLEVDFAFNSTPPGRLEWLKLYLPTGPAGDNLAAGVAAPAENAASHNFSLSLGSSSTLLGSGATVADVKRGEFGLLALVDAPYGDALITIGSVSIVAHWTPVAS